MENSHVLPNSQGTAELPRLERLLSFVDRGWPVLPLHYPMDAEHCSCGKVGCSSAGKHPMTKRGLHDATQDRSQVENWWREKPQANVGVLTGVSSGIVVLDIDPRHGGLDSLEELERQYGKFPKTLKVKTGGDELHFYFRHPGTPLSNRANILPGLDFRGDGGYIVAPPSVHKSLRSYSWEDESEGIAPLPQWLLALLQKRSSPPPQISNSNPKHVFFGEGSRNNSLLSLGGFLKSKGVEHDELSQVLMSLNRSVCNPPLEDQEVHQITLSLHKYEEEPWGELRELPEAAKTPELSPEYLPESLRNWCCDIADRMQVPLEFTAGPAIVMLASLIGRKIVICPKRNDDWMVVPNIWGVLLAPPGSLKSPAISSVLKVLTKLAIKARERYLSEVKQKESEEVIAKTEIEALKDALKVAIKQGKQSQIEEKKDQLALALKNYEKTYTVKERRYMTNDPTIEKLLTIMQDNPQGILLYRDELSGWLETMYKSGREGDREFFLESWNGDSPYSMDRIGRGSTFVDGLCLSVLGGLQPTKFSVYVSAVSKGGKSDDGLLQRLQIMFFPERRKT